MKIFSSVVFLTCSMSVIASCSGTDGKDGATGPAGAQGARGDAGPAGVTGATGTPGAAGPAGENGLDADGGTGLVDGGLTTGCLGPCHGFTGIVEQWKTSKHYATFIANLGGEEVPTWTGATACGNCHAIDGVEQRLAANVNFLGTAGPPNLALGQVNYLNTITNKIAESTYAGQATVAVVHCTTCHDSSANNDPHLTGESYTPGSFPLRVPTATTEHAIIEKSSAVGVSDGTLAASYGKGNACIWCHKSRKDVTNYITATNNLSSTHWGPHEGPQSDIYTGTGGYHYAGMSYGQSTHQGFTDGCVKCHMPDVASNQGVGNHSFYAQLSACQTAGCHANATNFDVGGGKSGMEAGIQQLRIVLNGRGWLTRSETAPYPILAQSEIDDQTFSADLIRPDPANTTLSAAEAGAVYNYLLLARGSAGGVHNPLYVKQLIYDSYKALTGNSPPGTTIRPGTP
jgi:hypothetical protein